MGQWQTVLLPHAFRIAPGSLVTVTGPGSTPCRLDFTYDAGGPAYYHVADGGSGSNYFGSTSELSKLDPTNGWAAVALNLVADDGASSMGLPLLSTKYDFSSADTAAAPGSFGTAGVTVGSCWNDNYFLGLGTGFQQQEPTLTAGEEASVTLNTYETHDALILSARLEHAGVWVAGDSASLYVDGALVYRAGADTASTLNCQPGWTLYQGFCYQFNNGCSQWEQARSSCAMAGGQLATFRDSAEEAWVRGAASYGADSWLGLQWDLNDADFLWLGTTQYDYSDLDPAADPISGNCIYMRNGIYWDYASCTSCFKYTCKKAAQGCQNMLSRRVDVRIPHDAPTVTITASVAMPSASLGGLYLDDIVLSLRHTIGLQPPVQAVPTSFAFVASTPGATAGGGGTASLGGLLAASSYCIAVVPASLAAGQGSYAVASVTTGSPSLPTPPLEISSTTVTGGSIHVDWKVPFDTGGVPIDTYALYMLPAAGTTTAPTTVAEFQPLAEAAAFNGSSPSLTFQVGGLTATTSYYFTATATNEVGTSGPGATLLKATGQLSAPSPPLAVALTASTGGALTLSWTPPVDSGGIDLATYVLLLNGTVATLEQEAAGATAPSGFMTRLNASALYNLTVHATNVADSCVGAGLPSDWMLVATQAPTLPTAPTALEVTEESGGSIALAWGEPLDIGGADVTAHTIEYRTSVGPGPWRAAGTAAASARTYEVFGLSADTDYELRVSASNSVGQGDWVSVVATTEAPEPPTAPLAPIVANVTGGAAHLTWSAPQNAGGIPITRYYLRVGTGSTLLRACSEAVSCVVYGLLNGTAYNITVVAENTRGQGPDSAIVTATTAAARDVPDPAPLPVVVDERDCTDPSISNIVRPPCNPAGGSIAFTLAQPNDMGGVAITDASIRYELLRANATHPSLFERVAYGTATSVVIGSLTPSTQYHWRAVVHTVAGASNASATLTVSTSAVTKPKAPAAPLLVSATGGRMCVRWVAPANTGGEAIDSYTLFSNDPMDNSDGSACGAGGGGGGGGGSCFQLATLPASTTEYCNSFLDASTQYGFRVAASNLGAGLGVISPKAVFSTLAAHGATAPPTTPWASSVTESSFWVDWDSPTDHGGSPFDFFMLEVRKSTDGE